MLQRAYPSSGAQCWRQYLATKEQGHGFWATCEGREIIIKPSILWPTERDRPLLLFFCCERSRYTSLLNRLNKELECIIAGGLSGIGSVLWCKRDTHQWMGCTVNTETLRSSQTAVTAGWCSINTLWPGVCRAGRSLLTLLQAVLWTTGSMVN